MMAHNDETVTIRMPVMQGSTEQGRLEKLGHVFPRELVTSPMSPPTGGASEAEIRAYLVHQWYQIIKSDMEHATQQDVSHTRVLRSLAMEKNQFTNFMKACESLGTIQVDVGGVIYSAMPIAIMGGKVGTENEGYYEDFGRASHVSGPADPNEYSGLKETGRYGASPNDTVSQNDTYARRYEHDEVQYAVPDGLGGSVARSGDDVHGPADPNEYRGLKEMGRYSASPNDTVSQNDAYARRYEHDEALYAAPSRVGSPVTIPDDQWRAAIKSFSGSKRTKALNNLILKANGSPVVFTHAPGKDNKVKKDYARLAKTLEALAKVNAVVKQHVDTLKHEWSENLTEALMTSGAASLASASPQAATSQWQESPASSETQYLGMLVDANTMGTHAEHAMPICRAMCAFAKANDVDMMNMHLDTAYPVYDAEAFMASLAESAQSSSDNMHAFAEFYQLLSGQRLDADAFKSDAGYREQVVGGCADLLSQPVAQGQPLCRCSHGAEGLQVRMDAGGQVDRQHHASVPDHDGHPARRPLPPTPEQ